MLTPKQEAFAQAVVSGMTQADAYRTAFNAKRSTAKTVQECASRLMADRKVVARVEKLREPVVKEAQITLKGHIDDLRRLRNMAVKERQMSAAISAEIACGKAAGLYVERVEASITSQVIVYLPENGRES